MDCREAQSLIVPFIENTLTREQLELFLDHIDHCSDCYDELEVYFIVYSGLRQLDAEEQDISDFKSELKQYILKQRLILEKYMQNKRRITVSSLVTVIIFFILLTVGYQLYRVENYNILQALKRFESVFITVQTEPVKKSVEQTMTAEAWKTSNYLKITKNEQIPESDTESDEGDVDEEDSSD